MDYLNTNSYHYWVRQVILPGINDTESQIAKLATYAYRADKIELIPYHTLGIEKWNKLGMKYSLKGVPTPTQESMDNLNAVLDSEVKKLKQQLS